MFLISEENHPSASGGWGKTLRVIALLALAATLSAVLLLPAILRNPRPYFASQCRNNLTQVAEAVRAYADEHGAAPPLMTVEADGRPLHSWRTLILPQLGKQALYDSIDLSKPWDDAANEVAAGQKVSTIFFGSVSGTRSETVVFAAGPFPTGTAATDAHRPLIIEGIRPAVDAAG